MNAFLKRLLALGVAAVCLVVLLAALGAVSCAAGFCWGLCRDFFGMGLDMARLIGPFTH